MVCEWSLVLAAHTDANGLKPEKVVFKLTAGGWAVGHFPPQEQLHQIYV